MAGSGSAPGPVADNTIGSVIAELKGALIADKESNDPTRALHGEIYLAALVQLQRISNIAALAISRINYVFIFDLDSHRFGKSSFL
jgi:hypothetical protein